MDNRLDANAMFRTRLFGFDKDQVRVCLQNMAADYTRAAEQIAWLKAELSSAEASSKQIARQEMTAGQVAQVLASASRVAEEIRIEAEKTANQALHEAQQEAVRLRTQAEADASELTSTAARRLTELEAEIQVMLERRQSVQMSLNRVADRLSKIAHSMRHLVESEDPLASFAPDH